jgi:fatty-acid peroxygenase
VRPAIGRSRGGFRLPVDAYGLIGARCDTAGTDVVEVRLPFGRSVVAMRGEEAARLFYDAERFRREGAAPRRVAATLFGHGGVQALDGEAHHRRKGLFLSLMGPEALTDLRALFAAGWDRAAERWERDGGDVVLYDEVGRLLCETVCTWAGVPLSGAEVGERTEQLHAMVESPAAVGPAHWRGRRARARAEGWAADLVERTRRGTLAPPAGRALRAVAEHREPDGRLLDPHTAAVELLNVLRPTVAVDRFVAFVACALHEHRAWAQRLRQASGPDDTDVERFVHEVRRAYPFFPAQAARVRRAFDWHGVHFRRNALVILDLYGTDHHAATWPAPERFDPDRFADAPPSAFAFVPQGGGDHATGHRCPGEWATIDLMKVATHRLAATLDYAVPLQDLRLSQRKVPALPESGFVITDVTRTPAP